MFIIVSSILFLAFLLSLMLSLIAYILSSSIVYWIVGIFFAYELRLFLICSVLRIIRRLYIVRCFLFFYRIVAWLFVQSFEPIEYNEQKKGHKKPKKRTCKTAFIAIWSKVYCLFHGPHARYTFYNVLARFSPSSLDPVIPANIVHPVLPPPLPYYPPRLRLRQEQQQENDLDNMPYVLSLLSLIDFYHHIVMYRLLERYQRHHALIEEIDE